VLFQRAKTFNGLEWKGIPYISPFVKSTNAFGKAFVVGGLFPLLDSDQALLQSLFSRFHDKTNLVYFDWELTGSRLEQWTYIAQLIRLLRSKPELPGDSVAMKWVRSMYKKLGPASTEVVRNGDREFSFSRSGTVPFTAFELQEVIDWTESPQFPSSGTLLGPLPRLVSH